MIPFFAFVICCHVPAQADVDETTKEASSKRDRPAALLAVEAARARLRTGEVRWSEKTRGDRPEMYFSGRFAGEDFTVTHRGDASGVLYRDPSGAPIAGISYPGPVSWLIRKDEAWSHSERNIGADLYTGPPPPMSGIDIRAIGLTAFAPRPGAPWRDALWKLGGEKAAPATFSSKKEGDDHVVTADLGDDWEHIWFIDSARGNNPTRIVTRRKSRPDPPWAEARCTLRKYDRVWFPDTVMYFDGKAEPRRVIHIESAEFDKPEHPKRLTPATIGIEPGTSVMKIEDWLAPKIAPETEQGLAWDGETIISIREFNSRMQAGEVRPGPTINAEYSRIRREQDDRRAAGQQLRGLVSFTVAYAQPNDWEKYVDYVARHCDFSDVQKASAQGVLKDLQVRAVTSGEQHHATFFKELQDRIDHLLTPTQRKIIRFLANPPGSPPASQPSQQAATSQPHPPLAPLPPTSQRQPSDRP